MLSRRCLIATALITSVCACSPPAVSLRGLQESEGDSVRDRRIEGEWIMVDPDFMEAREGKNIEWYRLRVEANDQGHYAVEVRDANRANSGRSEETTNYDLVLVDLNHQLFFDGSLDHVQSGQKTIERYFGLVPAHIVGQVGVADDLLVISVPDSDWVRKNAPLKIVDLAGRSHDDGLVVITEATDSLRTFMSLNADKYRGRLPFVYLCRPGVDCAARATGDMLTRTPDDADVLGAVADFQMKRENYGRAAELRRRLVEREPNAASHRSELGRALLFNRDFEGARREFVEAERLLRHAESHDAQLKLVRAVARNGISWAYFLEGRFEDAALASTAVEADEHLSVDAILLHYFGLQRSMRQAEAAAFLLEQAGSFRGSLEDQVLLIEIQGCVPACLSVPWKISENQERVQFFVALRDYLKGDIPSARRQLEHLASAAQKDSLFGFAARIEVEQLSSPAPR